MFGEDPPPHQWTSRCKVHTKALVNDFAETKNIVEDVNFHVVVLYLQHVIDRIMREHHKSQVLHQKRTTGASKFYKNHSQNMRK